MISYGGVEADSCLVDVNGDAIATFGSGVPCPPAPEYPSLSLFTSNNGYMATHMASFATTVSLLDNTFVTPTSLTSISCSFAGGCYFDIDSAGLTSMVQGGLLKVTACGNEAMLVDSFSDATAAVFKTPELVTLASETNAMREMPELLTPRNDFASSAAMEGVVFDGLNVPGMISTGTNCYVGVEYTMGKVAILEEVRFFMDYFSNKFDLYNGNLKFQGSNDGFDQEVVDIITIGAEIHEGWNSYKVAKPDYLSFRLFNAENNGCNGIGELKLYGKEVYDNQNSIVNC
jgi:hypothetical protein